MSFASPALLWGLLLIPVLLVAYLFIQRRLSKYAARFTNLDLLTKRRGRLAGAPSASATGARDRRAGRPAARDGEAAEGRRGPARRRDGRPDDGQLGVDEGHRRRSQPAGGGEVGGVDVPRPGAGPLPRRPGVLLERRAGARGADRRS